MDHLERAKWFMNEWRYGDDRGVDPQPSCAIAHALIAMVERLDKLIDTDGLDESRGFLRLDIGVS